MIKSHKIWNKNNPNDKIKPKKGIGIGRYKELIHHKDGDHDNDEPSNQQKMSNSEHATLHKTGIKASKKTRKKMSKAHMGNQYGIGNKNWLGKHHTKETKKKLSKISKGNQYALGHKHTEETKKRMSENRKGKCLENKHALGYKHTEETRRKMSVANKGKKLSKGHKAKLSKAKKLYWQKKKENSYLDSHYERKEKS